RPRRKSTAGTSRQLNSTSRLVFTSPQAMECPTPLTQQQGPSPESAAGRVAALAPGELEAGQNRIGRDENRSDPCQNLSKRLYSRAKLASKLSLHANVCRQLGNQKPGSSRVKQKRMGWAAAHFFFDISPDGLGKL
ncbi:MAG: hypothetical protein EBW88_09700, partial [Betaproteobacteria bacterium]|nr:hypothetical protein [Betaproteobacteria bacterium]